jgi:hypothetical protein
MLRQRSTISLIRTLLYALALLASHHDPEMLAQLRMLLDCWEREDAQRL